MTTDDKAAREAYVAGVAADILKLKDPHLFLRRALADALDDKTRVAVLTTALQRIKAGAVLAHAGSIHAEIFLQAVIEEVEKTGIK